MFSPALHVCSGIASICALVSVTAVSWYICLLWAAGKIIVEVDFSNHLGWECMLMCEGLYFGWVSSSHWADGSFNKISDSHWTGGGCLHHAPTEPLASVVLRCVCVCLCLHVHMRICFCGPLSCLSSTRIVVWSMSYCVSVSVCVCAFAYYSFFRLIFPPALFWCL